MDLSKLTKTALLEKCKELGFTKCKSKNKTELIDLIHSKETGAVAENQTESISPSLPPPSIFAHLEKLLTTYGIKKIADELNLANGTISRWIELKNIPKNYDFDILKLAKVNIVYSDYTTKEKDQFFTPVDTAKKCFDIFCDTIRPFGESPENFTYIEPSAGDGNFLKVLPAGTIAMDIEPRHPTVINCDYLEWKPPITDVNSQKFVVFGNPPFGLRGHTALKFINHSYPFSEYVCFILPQLFESDGKGVPRKRVKGFHLIHSSKLDTNFYEPNNNIIKINTIFQVWSKHHTSESYNIKNHTTEHMKIYSMSDGGTVATTRNKAMIGKCDIYIPSTCFGKENMKCYHRFEDLPGKKGYGIVFHTNKEKMISKMETMELDKIAFLSTNSAYNLRSSQIYSLYEPIIESS